ncbi:MAG: prohibitin family protein [Acidobacteria bacterium]|nr:prohibitin family protein [Acidobacteriota bacterium]
MRGALRRFTDWWARHELKLTIFALLLLLLVAYLWPSIVIPVNAGERGVYFSRFSGTRVDWVYLEGVHIIPPWNSMVVYNVRLQAVDRTVKVLTKDGLEVAVLVTIRFRPSKTMVGMLHARVGPGYVQSVVIPEVESGVRAVVSRYRPDDLYEASFLSIQEQIVNYSRSEILEQYVYLDDVLVKSILLPPRVAEAIQQKLAIEQAALEMEYRLSREELEAKRKRIEAAGIRDFQSIIATGLSTQYLRYKGIEATLELSKSPNAKVIVVGSGSGGLPLIFNADTLPSTVPGSGVTAPPVPGAKLPATATSDKKQ